MVANLFNDDIVSLSCENYL